VNLLISMLARIISGVVLVPFAGWLLLNYGVEITPREITATSLAAAGFLAALFSVGARQLERWMLRLKGEKPAPAIPTGTDPVVAMRTLSQAEKGDPAPVILSSAERTL
jgi:hypothetical protein